MDADLGYGAEAGSRACTLRGETPEGLPGSGHRGRREGSSVGSLGAEEEEPW